MSLNEARDLEEIYIHARWRARAVREGNRHAAQVLMSALKVPGSREPVPEEFIPRLSNWHPDPKQDALLQARGAAPPEPEPLASPARPARKELKGSEPSVGSRPQPAAQPKASAQLPLPPDVIRIEPNGLLFSRGEPAERLMILLTGHVELFDPDTGHALTILDPGSYFGEQSILTGGAHTISARALDEVTCKLIEAETLRELLRGEPPFVKVILKALMLQLFLQNDLRFRSRGLYASPEHSSSGLRARDLHRSRHVLHRGGVH